MAKTKKVFATKTAYWLDQAWQIFVALVVVFGIRSSIVEPFKIPSGSMYPTLYVGDFIFVNKFAYNFKVPFSDYFGAKPINIIKRDPPKRGDIIVFLSPPDPSIHFIKRAVAVAGDEIELKNKVLYINGVEQKQVAVPEDFRLSKLKNINDDKYGTSHILMMKESLTQDSGTKEHLIMIDQNNMYEEGKNVNLEKYKVPEGHVFAMGDNRDFSNDSRFWGPVPYDNISGRAELIWFSAWLNFENFSDSIFNPSRIGTILSRQ